MKILVALMLLFSSLAMAEPIDINKADADTIAKSLKGIGPKKAEAIVQYRQANGPFKSLQDIERVSGIGPKTVQANEKDIIFSDAPVAPEKIGPTDKKEIVTKPK